jgi:hypothetical protein
MIVFKDMFTTSLRIDLSFVRNFPREEKWWKDQFRHEKCDVLTIHNDKSEHNEDSCELIPPDAIND